ncbi:MAG: GNAT family N-acetyltransferase [Ectothiorhodospiraceae bacterium]|nr:GNAT family N-acetyltransferase [Chromatiales bacterium]MCP5154718.1 GNAT family N-acetyltransferase [Ectothiorhodospiraceae bacterium]
MRPAAPDDRAVVERLLAALQDVERALCDDRPPGATMAAEHLAYLEATVAACDGAILVAEVDRVVVGFVAAFVQAEDEGDAHLEPSARRWGWIGDLYVEPRMRRRGIAAALLDAAERHFAAHGLTRVKLAFVARNVAARDVYVRRGYGPYEEIWEKRLVPDAPA